ncbi:hypothetical protein RI129_009708 [Pyrocoelia pectoralis]|uniref:Uncharacterized protein n=1 Tax=Pyrocoelia pectoralis TaxID=417401 RepID=A0AAN7V9U7_9COLE
MWFVKLEVLIIICYCSGSVRPSPIQDHSDDFYWRDYNDGEVPKDALPGGMDRDHKPTYIGQVVSQGAIIPGQIIGGAQKIYFQGDYSAREASENIKILCTKNPENFEWAKTNGNDVRHFSRLRLIPGGYQYGDHLYIGRGIAGNMLSVGKITIPSDSSRMATFKAAVDSDTFSPTEFEVLNYRMRNPDDSNSSPKITLLSTLVFLTIPIMLL